MTFTATHSKFDAIKKPIAATIAMAVIATGAMATSVTDAEAGKKHRRAAGAFIGGLIVGGALAHGHRRNRHYDERVYYGEDCWTEKRVYWRHGHRRVRHVEVCRDEY